MDVHRRQRVEREVIEGDLADDLQVRRGHTRADRATVENGTGRTGKAEDEAARVAVEGASDDGVVTVGWQKKSFDAGVQAATAVIVDDDGLTLEVELKVGVEVITAECDVDDIAGDAGETVSHCLRCHQDGTLGGIAIADLLSRCLQGDSSTPRRTWLRAGLAPGSKHVDGGTVVQLCEQSLKD